MKKAIGETERRRAKQISFNEENGIEPKQIVKRVKDLIDGVYSEKSGKEAERLQANQLERARVEDMSEKDVAKESSVWRSRCSNMRAAWSSNRLRGCAISWRCSRSNCSGAHPCRFPEAAPGLKPVSSCYPTKLMGNVVH